MPVIRIDDEVYRYLQTRARAFEDTPNDVLRREFELDGPSPVPQTTKRLSAKALMKRWGVEAAQGRYHRDGHFFENLTAFPGVLFDPDGYILLQDKEQHDKCEEISVGEKTNVKGGIKALPGYVRFDSLPPDADTFEPQQG